MSAHETAAKERISIATQLSEWGEQTSDDAISDVSDKIGVLLSEMGEQEDNYAHALDESRGILKTIRNTEKSVQPSRDGKNKIADEIMKIKSKEPESTRLVVLEQELVRAEAENLVAEAQLTNIVSFSRANKEKNKKIGGIGGVANGELTDPKKNRRDKNSRKPIRLSFLLRSNGQISRLFLRDMD